MKQSSKRKRQSRSAISVANENKKCLKNWKLQLANFDHTKLQNRNGKVRSVEENQLILASLHMLLDKEIELLSYNRENIMQLSWTKIEKQLAGYLHVGKDYIAALRKTLFESGEIRVFGNSPKAGVKTTRGKASPNYKKQNLLDKEQLCDLVNEVDINHAAGRTVTNMLMRNYVRYKHNIDVSRTTMGRYMKSLGLSWKPIKNKKRSASAYRADLLHEFIVKFNNIYTDIKTKGDDSDYVFVFTDESYIHRGHGKAKSYFRDGGPDVNRKSSKGDRLVIMHAISPNKGPLSQKGPDKKYIFDTEWTGDTPHSKPREDEKKTCETIWKATSMTGDYHDNMNSEMFMKWVEEKLIPTFEEEYKNKKMVLVCDNAAYHHKRELGSLASMKKEQLVDKCAEKEVQYIDIPVTKNRLDYLNNNIIDYAQLYNDEWIRVTFHQKKFKGTTTKKNPLIPTKEELKYGMVRYFQEHQPELLECLVTKAMKERGHMIIWTPPYCPHLQPIELFWAAGKNHAASHAKFEIENYETVKHLREGWYGNTHLFTPEDDNNRPDDYRIQRKEPVDCKKLFDHCVENINTIAIPICPGIEGVIGDLVVDETYVNAHGDLPIDIFLLGIDDVLDINSNALDVDVVDDDDNATSFGI